MDDPNNKDKDFNKSNKLFTYKTLADGSVVKERKVSKMVGKVMTRAGISRVNTQYLNPMTNDEHDESYQKKMKTKSSFSQLQAKDHYVKTDSLKSVQTLGGMAEERKIFLENPKFAKHPGESDEKWARRMKQLYKIDLSGDHTDEQLKNSRKSAFEFGEKKDYTGRKRDVVHKSANRKTQSSKDIHNQAVTGLKRGTRHKKESIVDAYDDNEAYHDFVMEAPTGANDALKNAIKITIESTHSISSIGMSHNKQKTQTPLTAEEKFDLANKRYEEEEAMDDEARKEYINNTKDKSLYNTGDNVIYDNQCEKQYVRPTNRSDNPSLATMTVDELSRNDVDEIYDMANMCGVGVRKSKYSNDGISCNSTSKTSSPVIKKTPNIKPVQRPVQRPKVISHQTSRIAPNTTRSRKNVAIKKGVKGRSTAEKYMSISRR